MGERLKEIIAQVIRQQGPWMQVLE